MHMVAQIYLETDQKFYRLDEVYTLACLVCPLVMLGTYVTLIASSFLVVVKLLSYMLFVHLFSSFYNMVELFQQFL